MKEKLLVFLLLISPLLWPLMGKTENLSTIRYVPIGDSYTIGSGVRPSQSWPVLLVNHLQAEGIPIMLVDNPAQGGWTTELALEKELVIFKRSKPTFSTLMIGTNDLARGVSANDFRANLSKLMDAMLKELQDHQRLLVINIPNFLCTPKGVVYTQERKMMQELIRFNKIIEEEANKRELTVVDIYSVSQIMCTNPALISQDGLHPSEKGYLLWEKAIYEQAKILLKNQVKYAAINQTSKSGGNMVVFETNRGNIELKLYPETAPKTVENFKGLVQKKYYDGTIFHRVIKQFMIQGGDPTGTGRGGQSIWGKKFEDEVTAKVKFDRPGLLAMANAGPNTNGSQFFITTAATPWLNMNHTIFGEVVGGMETVTAIEQTAADGNDRPSAEQKIIRAYIKEK